MFSSTQRLKLNLAFLCLFISVFLVGSANATNHYVRAGASGSATGADWTNAYTALPSSLSRGDTYIVAGGTYGTHTFNDTVSGTNTITIRKASSATGYRDDLVAGWSTAYETTQAVFGSLTFTSSYYVLDGVTPANTLWPSSGLGFKVSDSNYPIQLGNQAAPASNNIFRRIELRTPGSSSDTEQFDIYELDNEASVNNTWSYCLFGSAENAVHSAGGGGISNWTFEYSYFEINWSSGTHHGEQFAIWYGSSNHVIRYNYFNSYQGTGGIMAGGDGATETNIQIYGNVFYNFGLNNGAGGAANGAFGTMDSSGTTNLTNWKIYNNTFVNGDVRLSSPSGGSATGWVVENNLFYNTSTDTFNANPSGTYDYNYYPTSGWGWTTGTHDQASNTNHFVNLAGGDYTLASDTNPGVTLSSPYNIDPNGTTRAANGTWDRGAFQIASATTYSLTVSLAGTGSGTVTSAGGTINCGSACSVSGDPAGDTWVLTATSATGSSFMGWSGTGSASGCSGTGTCSITMGANTTVTATFNTTSSSPSVAKGITLRGVFR